MEEINKRLPGLSLAELFQLTEHLGGYFKMYLTRKGKTIGVVVIAGENKLQEVNAALKKLEDEWNEQVKERNMFLS